MPISTNGIGYGPPVRPERTRQAPVGVGRDVAPPDGDTARPGVARSASDAASAAPPEGVDPALWSVLTAEERSFFARSRSMGPLTYGPSSTPRSEAPPVMGGRVDVRV